MAYKASQIFQWNPILSQRPTNSQKLTAKIPFWRYKLTKKSLNPSRWVAPNILMKKVTKAKQTKYKPLYVASAPTYTRFLHPTDPCCRHRAAYPRFASKFYVFGLYMT